MLHVGPIGAGRRVAFNERLRHDFSARFHGILAFDCELDSVIESIFGNRKDSYMLIRGISDYKDGTTGSATRGARGGGGSGGKDWQQYAALMAALRSTRWFLNLKRNDLMSNLSSQLPTSKQLILWKRTPSNDQTARNRLTHK